MVGLSLQIDMQGFVSRKYDFLGTFLFRKKKSFSPKIEIHTFFDFHKTRKQVHINSMHLLFSVLNIFTFEC